MLCHIFEKIFSSDDDVVELYASALNAWALLFTTIDDDKIISSTFKLLDVFVKLLNSSHLNIRIATGEIIALLLEKCNNDDNDDDDDDNNKKMLQYTEQLLKSPIPTIIKKLSIDSQKFRSKQDRKEQRFVFREVLQYLEENEKPESTIRIGKKEQIILDTWKINQQYNYMCKLLTSDMSIYLTKNNFIRNIFCIEDAPILKKKKEPVDDNKKIKNKK
jgi:hypothetical protein